MKRIFIILALLVLISAVFGCGNRSKDNGSNGNSNGDGGGEKPGDTVSPNIYEKDLTETLKKLEDEGKYPKLDRSDNLLGIDNNNNGVRDDIEEYIKSRPDTTEPQKKALMQLAKTLQEVFKIDVENREQAKAVSEINGRSVMCLGDKFDKDANNKGLEAILEMQKLMFNTKARHTVYKKYNKTLSGTTWRAPLEDTCEDIPY